MRLFSKLLTNFFVAALCGFFLIQSCGSSKNNLKPLDVSVAPLYVAQTIQAKVLFGNAYTDRIELKVQDNVIGLEINGNVPDGCSRLKIDEDSTSISIRSWKNKNDICTMALEPFHVFYPIQNKILLESILKSDSVLVNSSKMKLWK